MGREQYANLSSEELLDKIEELEGVIVEKKKETKSTKKESSKTIEDLQKQIDELKTGTQSTQIEVFLKDKNLSEDERKVFEEKLAKGLDKDEALFLATRESEKQKENQELMKKNQLDGTDAGGDKKTIPFDKLAELPQEEYNKTVAAIDAGTIEVEADKQEE